MSIALTVWSHRAFLRRQSFRKGEARDLRASLLKARGKYRYALLFENKTNGCYEAPSPIIVDSLFMAESPNL